MVGLLRLDGVMCIAIDKKDMNDGSYFYEVAFSNGKEIVQLTTGKKGDELQFGAKYNLGLNYREKKLKLADFELVK